MTLARMILVSIIIHFLQGAVVAQPITDTIAIIDGNLYGGLPVEIAIVQNGSKIIGTSTYGSENDINFMLEGELNQNGTTLYEIDEYGTLSGIIEVNNENTSAIWNSVDYNINLPVEPRNKNHHYIETDYVDYNSYVSIHLSSTDPVFIKTLSSRIEKVIQDIKEKYIEGEEAGTGPSHRFVNRAIGINKVSLDTEDLLSGHITIYNNRESDVMTIPYIYDKNKEELISLEKIFKKGFNYSFFLKQYISQQKDRMKGMSRLETKWVRDAHFMNYKLAVGGIEFFTDYSTIFGSKSIVVSYEELDKSINNRSIERYIKEIK